MDKKYILVKFKSHDSVDWKFYFTTIEDWENDFDNEAGITECREVSRFTEEEVKSLSDQFQTVLEATM